MTKKFFEITGDFFLMTLLMGIILTSVFAVISMTPLTAERLGYTKEEAQILGVDSEEEKLILKSDYETNPFFQVEEFDNKTGLTMKLSIGPMSADEYQKKIFSIENPDENSRNFKVTMKVASDYKSFADLGIEYFNEEYYLLQTNGAENVLNGTINPKSEAEFKFLINPKERINFPLEVEVHVEEIITQFEYPE